MKSRKKLRNECYIYVAASVALFFTTLNMADQTVLALIEDKKSGMDLLAITLGVFYLVGSIASGFMFIVNNRKLNDLESSQHEKLEAPK